jgi:hypothetical protein
MSFDILQEWLGRRLGETRLTFPDKANMRPGRLFFRLPLDRINWLASCFLIGTLALTLTAVPLYMWFFGLDWFQVVLFLCDACRLRI